MTNQQNILGPKGDILTIGFISKRVAETSREASKTPSPNSDHLTVKEIEHYCQGKIVRATLQRLQRPPADVHRLAAWVKEKAKSIFLLLVYNEELQSIETLRQSGLTDANLPISVNYDDDDNIVVLDRSNRPCRLFTGWSQARVNAFASHQWLFMALPFLDDPFENNFQEKQCLDFRALSSKSDRGGFGRVSLVEAPLSHQDGGLKYAAVAVKYVINPFDEADPVKFYNKERETLETMRRLSHPHLIKAHAAFQRGEDRGFIFPWADGGNLLSVWDKAYTNLSDQGLLIWALTQMTGLCDGIDKLHATNTRHGDLKPANILCFSPDSSGRGKLKVADVGLAKYHREYTDRRLDPTTTKYASWRYAPPEAAEIPRPTYSLRYDMWCFGCVLLDFLVWLTLGPQQLDKYFKEYKDKNGDDVPFWEGDKMKVSRTTIKWMQEVSQALKMAPSQDPLLRPLLDLIQDRLLRITVDHRVYSQEALRRMKEILSQGIQYPPFHINPSLQSPVKSRTNDIVKYDFVAFSKTNNRTSNLQDTWQVVTDNHLVHVILSRMHRDSSLPQRVPVPTICQACSNIDLQLSQIDLARNLDEIRQTSKECAICRLLDACLSERSISPKIPIQLFQRKFSLSLSQNGPPLLSLYSERDYDPEKLPYPQLSSPNLPKLTKLQQLELLRQWVNLCDEEHQCLSPPSISSYVSTMPKRLIDVGTQDQSCLRLVETSQGDPQRYITLSHCWGSPPSELSFQTKSDNIEKLKSQIDYGRLPRTFRDAVVVTRALGVQYLWIDSLCIIQDDDDDKKSQFGAMGDYYSSAYVTIAATSAKSSTEPFLLDRADRHYATIPFGDDRVHLAQAIDNFEADVERGILNTRAWVLQERALSRRTIHFTSTQMYWECGHGIHCETLAQLRNPQSQFLGDHDFPSLGVGYYKDERIQLIQYLHETYTSMQLSFDTDRQFAIAGLHARLSTSKPFQSRMDYGVFWRNFERFMLWRAYDAESLTRITYSEEHSVPSWSWMAFNGKIGYHKAPFGKVIWTGDLTKPLTEGSLPSDHFKQGILAKARKVNTNKGDPLRLIVVDTPVATDFDEDLWRFIAIGEYEDSDRVGDSLCCGLLIRPVFGVSSNVFQRAGAGTIRRACLSSTFEEINLM